MAGVKRFEDLVAWQEARELVRRVYRVSKRGGFAKDFQLGDQVRGAAISVTGNIAEGFERSRPGEFHQFPSTAKASCAEVRSHLYTAFDAGYLSAEELNELRSLSESVSRIVGALRAAVARNKLRTPHPD